MESLCRHFKSYIIIGKPLTRFALNIFGEFFYCCCCWKYFRKGTIVCEGTGTLKVLDKNFLSFISCKQVTRVRCSFICQHYYYQLLSRAINYHSRLVHASHTKKKFADLFNRKKAYLCRSGVNCTFPVHYITSTMLLLHY